MSEEAYRICKVAVMLAFLAVAVWIGKSYSVYVQHTRYIYNDRCTVFDTETQETDVARPIN